VNSNEAETCYAALEDGTATLYKNTQEMFEDWDKEDLESDD